MAAMRALPVLPAQVCAALLKFDPALACIRLTPAGSPNSINMCPRPPPLVYYVPGTHTCCFTEQDALDSAAATTPSPLATLHPDAGQQQVRGEEYLCPP